MGINGRAGVTFGQPDRGRGKASRAAAGRTCDEDGCATILSTYNASTRCGIHEKAETKHALYRGPGSRTSRQPTD